MLRFAPILLLLLVACGSTAISGDAIANQQQALGVMVAAAPSAPPRTATRRPATATSRQAATATRRPATATAAPRTATRQAATAVPRTPTAPPTVLPTAPPDTGAPYALSFVDLYSGASITGPIVSPLAQSLNGRTVVMQGFMAPPLKPDLDFFVLTKTPMVACPFCSTASDWPFDIVFVRLKKGTVNSITPTQAIRVVGTFSVGVETDAATGFVSMLRIQSDSVTVIGN